MGGKSGKGSHVPYEAPNTLHSAQILRVVDAVSEGVIEGFANGNEHPWKSIFFNDTVVQNADGSFNFKGVSGYFTQGTEDQPYIPGFDLSERTVPVSVQVKKATPVSRTISDSSVDRLRVTVGIDRNSYVNNQGDVLPAETQVSVELVSNTNSYKHIIVFNEKSSGTYFHDIEFNSLPPVPFHVKVSRITDDASNDRTSNATFFSNYVEIIDAKLSHPHTALAALKIDSQQFANGVPKRNYLIHGIQVRIPSNYDPITRQYSGTTWDGSFKTGWTNNPAWIFYDLMTQPRYSSLARRVRSADIDKWSLYKVARYCDEMVSDGFGGQEPRFVCNAYITDQRQAGDVLQDLASVFTGLPLWAGNVATVVVDQHTDPVALYTNSNVEKGSFLYSGASLKSIHTAVNVRYVDKNDGYRTKVEHVKDDAAIKRYGFNLKTVTAFGCDSRGQAARFGAWLLQTELRQQGTVTFTVGREGLRHLPYDVIQVMDNNYAGAELSGRFVSSSGNVVELDREVENAQGKKLSVVFIPAGPQAKPVVRELNIVQQLTPTKLRVSESVKFTTDDSWILVDRVKPRLYRAIGIKDNVDEGTYTITALLHDPAKYSNVDNWARFDNLPSTLHNVQPELYNPNVSTDNGSVSVTWDNLSSDGDALTYDIKIFKSGELYRHITDATSPEIKLQDLPTGDYTAEIRARNARGTLSDPIKKAWQINYDVTGLRTTGKLMAVQVDWNVPEVASTQLVSEVWYGTNNNFQTANKLVSLPYPQGTYTLQNVQLSDRLWFWVRMVDVNGNYGQFAGPVAGQADTNPQLLMDHINGNIGESSLSRELVQSLDNRINQAGENAAQIVDSKAKAIKSEVEVSVQQKVRETKNLLDAELARVSREAAQKATQLGNKITQVENKTNEQTQRITTLAAAQDTTAAALEVEKRARADGDRAEAAQRATLVAKVGDVESALNREVQVRTESGRTQAAENSAIKSRLVGAEGSVTELRQTLTEQGVTQTQQFNAITARLSNLGGVNLLVDSEYIKMGAWNSSSQLSSSVFRGRRLIRLSPKSGGVAQIGVAQLAEKGLTRLVAGQQYTLSFNVQGTAGFSRSGLNYIYLVRDAAEGGNHRLEAVSITPNLSNRVKVTFTAPWSSNTVRLLIGANGTFAANDWFAFHSVKLERGSVATDWSATPDDLDAAVSAVDATLTEYKRAQATKDATQTSEIAAAKSQAQGNAAEIQTLKTTKADTNQVVAVARTGLQSEWRAAASSAQTAAVQAASVDAQRKADAAKTAAERAAQAKADAAKAAAIAAASADAASKANAAKAQAIADAAAKDAVLKQQAAADAQAKADAVKRVADAAQDLASRAHTELNKFKKTVATQNAAMGTRLTELVSQVGTAGGNISFDSEFTHGVSEQLTNTLSDVVTLQNMSTFRAVKFDRSRPLPEVYWTAANVRVAKGIYQFSAYVLNTHATGVKVYGRHLKADRKWSPSGPTKKVTSEFVPPSPVSTDPTILSNYTRVILNIDLRNSEDLASVEVAFHIVKSTSSTPNAAVYITKPMICEIPSLESPAVPYSPNGATPRLSASVTQLSQTTAQLNGKLSALHTIKAETINGNRKVMSGLSFGVDGTTADSEILMYANKLTLVDPTSKAMKKPFSVVRVGGQYKFLLDGDLIGNGMILGSHIAANQVIDSPIIRTAKLSIGTFTMEPDGSFSSRPQGQSGVTMTNEGIVVRNKRGQVVCVVGLPPRS